MRNVARALLVASAVLLAPAGSPAATVSHDLSGTVASGTFAGTAGTGSFSYDDAGLANSGDEYRYLDDGLEIEFTIFGQTFTHLNDVEQSEFYPELVLDDGTPIELNFIVSEVLKSSFETYATPIDQPGVISILFSDLEEIDSGGFDVAISIEEGVTDDGGTSEVPVPGALPLFASGLGLLGWRLGRRRAAS